MPCGRTMSGDAEAAVVDGVFESCNGIVGRIYLRVVPREAELKGDWLSWLERSDHTRKVTGSSPVSPILACLGGNEHCLGRDGGPSRGGLVFFAASRRCRRTQELQPGFPFQATSCKAGKQNEFELQQVVFDKKSFLGLARGCGFRLNYGVFTGLGSAQHTGSYPPSRTGCRTAVFGLKLAEFSLRVFLIATPAPRKPV